MAGEDDLALKYLLKGREIAPDDMEILTLISDWYISNGRYSDNLALLEPVVEDHVFDAHLAYNLALSYQDAGKNKLAANNYEIAANELGDNPDYLKHAALFYREIGNVDKEKQTLKKNTWIWCRMIWKWRQCMMKILIYEIRINKLLDPRI